LARESTETGGKGGKEESEGRVNPREEGKESIAEARTDHRTKIFL
jgi:hypothetical protein